MVDFENKLGLSPTDLTLRTSQVRRPDDWIDLDSSSSVDLAVVQSKFAPEIVKSRMFRDESTIWVRRDRIVDIGLLLRDHPDTSYNFLSDLTAVDLLKIAGRDDERFEIVYNLYSLTTYRRLRLKAQVPDEQPMPGIDTVEGVWPAANWLEREVYDLFGIRFNNHSDMRRIQMPDEWIGHPLRKDYPLGGEEVEFSFNVRGRNGARTPG